MSGAATGHFDLWLYLIAGIFVFLGVYKALLAPETYFGQVGVFVLLVFVTQTAARNIDSASWISGDWLVGLSVAFALLLALLLELVRCLTKPACYFCCYATAAAVRVRRILIFVFNCVWSALLIAGASFSLTADDVLLSFPFSSNAGFVAVFVLLLVARGAVGGVLVVLRRRDGTDDSDEGEDTNLV
jgi:hypothetical protein